MVTLLAIDDQPGVLSSLRSALGLEGIYVVTASNESEALEAARRERPQVVLIDLKLPDTDGATLAGQIKSILPGAAIAAMSGDSALLAQTAGFDAHLEKPLRAEVILEVLRDLEGAN